MVITITISTGHFAMFQIVTAVEPRPMTSPRARASGPVITSARATAESMSTIASVIATWIGRSFQKGRPSSTP